MQRAVPFAVEPLVGQEPPQRPRDTHTHATPCSPIHSLDCTFLILTNLRHESTPSAGSLPTEDPLYDHKHKLTMFLEFQSTRLESRYQNYRFDIFVSTVRNRILLVLIPTGVAQILLLLCLPFLIKSKSPSASSIPAMSESFDMGLVITGLLLAQLVISVLVLETPSSWEVGSGGENNEQEKEERHGKRSALMTCALLPIKPPHRLLRKNAETRFSASSSTSSPTTQLCTFSLITTCR